jgi:hypothetical protein
MMRPPASREILTLRQIAEQIFGKPPAWLYERIDAFRKLGFPDKFPLTNGHERTAVEAWVDSFNPRQRERASTTGAAAAEDGNGDRGTDLSELERRLERMRQGRAA